MRKGFIKLTLLAMASCLALGLSACHEHSYTIVNYDETQHWMECECGDVSRKTKGKHVSSGMATEMEDEFCVECAYVINPSPKVRTIIYHTSGGSDLAPTRDSLANLQKLTLPTPEKEGYDFEGWYMDKELTTPCSLEVVKEPILELYAKYTPKLYTVELKFNKEDVFTVDGEIKQTVSVEQAFSPVTITPRIGHVFDYYEINGTRYESNVIEVPFAYEDITVNVAFDYATYELPIIDVTTKERAGVYSKETYTEMQFNLENCEGELSAVTGGIRLRGNTTMLYDKKPYRIKFDKKQSLFGLEKAKSWVLLADYLNPSGLRNYLAMTLGNAADGLGFTPTPHKVNLYLNGQFLGLYTLCEQVQENKGRMDIEMDTVEIDGEEYLPTTLTDLMDYNFFLCMDYKCQSDEGAAENLTYIIEENFESAKTFEMKYPERESFSTEEQFNSYVTQLRAYIADIFTLITTGSLTEIEEKINVKSLIDYYIIDAILLERDHFWCSFNMYYKATSDNPDEAGKLSFGPIWDYDFTIVKEFSNEPNQVLDFTDATKVDPTQIEYTNFFFKIIERFPELQQRVKVRYNELFKQELEDFLNGYDLLTYQMRESLQLNHERWYAANYGDELTTANIEFLEKYLRARKAFLDEEWKVTTGA